MSNQELLKIELKLLLWQFIKDFNQDAQYYFKQQIEEIVDKYYPTEEK